MNMYELEIIQSYNKATFEFDDVLKAVEMMLIAKKHSAVGTTISISCVVAEEKGAEDDNN